MPGSALQEVGREEGTREEEGRDEGRAGRTKKLLGAEMQEKERRMRLGSLGLCARTAKLVSPSPCTFVSPAMCLWMQSHCLSSDHLCSL